MVGGPHTGALELIGGMDAERILLYFTPLDDNPPPPLRFLNRTDSNLLVPMHRRVFSRASTHNGAGTL